MGWAQSVDGWMDVALVSVGVRSVIAADLDGDGDQDLASASKDDNTIAWYGAQHNHRMMPLQTTLSGADGLDYIGP